MFYSGRVVFFALEDGKDGNMEEKINEVVKRNLDSLRAIFKRLEGWKLHFGVAGKVKS